MKPNNGVLTAALLFGANLVFLIEALKLPRPFEQGEPGPAFYPLVLSAILFIACIAVMISELRERRGLQFDFRNPKVLRPLGMAGATGIYIAAFEPLGYWVSTLVFTFFLGFIFEYGRKYTLVPTIGFCALTAVSITAAGWLFFDTLFDLHLPKGGF